MRETPRHPRSAGAVLCTLFAISGAVACGGSDASFLTVEMPIHLEEQLEALRALGYIQ